MHVQEGEGIVGAFFGHGEVLDFDEWALLDLLWSNLQRFHIAPSDAFIILLVNAGLESYRQGSCKQGQIRYDGSTRQRMRLPIRSRLDMDEKSRGNRVPQQLQNEDRCHVRCRSNAFRHNSQDVELYLPKPVGRPDLRGRRPIRDAHRPLWLHGLDDHLQVVDRLGRHGRREEAAPWCHHGHDYHVPQRRCVSTTNLGRCS